MIAQRRCRRSIPLDNKTAVLKDFPRCLERKREQDLPPSCKSPEHEHGEEEEQKAVRYVSEAVRIKQLLRIIRAARVAGPNLKLSAGTKKQSPLRSQQHDHRQQDHARGDNLEHSRAISLCRHSGREVNIHGECSAQIAEKVNKLLTATVVVAAIFLRVLQAVRR